DLGLFQKAMAGTLTTNDVEQLQEAWTNSMKSFDDKQIKRISTAYEELVNKYKKGEISIEELTEAHKKYQQQLQTMDIEDTSKILVDPNTINESKDGIADLVEVLSDLDSVYSDLNE